MGGYGEMIRTPYVLKIGCNQIIRYLLLRKEFIICCYNTIDW